MPSRRPQGEPFSRWGHNVVDRRTVLRLSQADVAARAGISEKHLSQIETGKSFPYYDVQARLADALSSEVSDLFPRTVREGRLESIAAEYDDLLERVGGGC